MTREAHYFDINVYYNVMIICTNVFPTGRSMKKLGIESVVRLSGLTLTTISNNKLLYVGI